MYKEEAGIKFLEMRFADTHPVEWKHIQKTVNTNTSDVRLNIHMTRNRCPWLQFEGKGEVASSKITTHLRLFMKVSFFFSKVTTNNNSLH